MSELKATKGYKVFKPDFTCRGFQFQEGKDYKHTGKIKVCDSGFHFCLKANDCFKYYDFDVNNIVCEVEALGNVLYHDEDSKACTDHIKIIRKLSWEEVLVMVNTGKANTGRENSGDRNSGDSNSGDSNSGDSNSGDSNSGDRNSGDSNSGYRNSGDSNSGYRNSGYRNSGDSNSGYRNSGDSNSGDRNSGYRNSGYSNSGSWNSGDSNSGSWNSGDRNSGDSNSGYRNSGAFCTEPNPKILLFDKPTDISVKDWERSEAVTIMSQLLDPCLWISEEMMTEDEKKQHPKYSTAGGYLKTITYKEAWANMWGNLTDDKKKVFITLPNFNAKKFKEITGVKV